MLNESQKQKAAVFLEFPFEPSPYDKGFHCKDSNNEQNTHVRKNDALFNFGAGILGADLMYLKRLDLRRKYLRKPINHISLAANQTKITKCWRIKVKIEFENKNKEERAIFQEN